MYLHTKFHVSWPFHLGGVPSPKKAPKSVPKTVPPPPPHPPPPPPTSNLNTYMNEDHWVCWRKWMVFNIESLVSLTTKNLWWSFTVAHIIVQLTCLTLFIIFSVNIKKIYQHPWMNDIILSWFRQYNYQVLPFFYS